MTRYLVAEFGKNSSGFGDRIVGLTSLILIARYTKRQLLIKWDYPDISNVLDLGEYNFYTAHINIKNAKRLYIKDKFKYKDVLQTQDLDVVWPQDVVIAICTQAIAEYIYHNPHYQTGNYQEEMIQTYRSIFTVYMKPMFDYRQQQKLAAVQLRTGDLYMNVGTYQPIKNLSPVLKKLSTFVKTHLPHHTIHFTSDNEIAYETFEKMVHQKVSQIPASRFHFSKTHSKTTQIQALITDLLVLVHADILIFSYYSNYGRIAALMNSHGRLYSFGFPNFDVIPVTDLSSLFSKRPFEKGPMLTLPTDNLDMSCSSRLWFEQLAQSSSDWAVQKIREWGGKSITPNDITTFRLGVVMALFVSLYYPFRYSWILSVSLCLLAYWLDEVDGNYARTYQMTSRFGKEYDIVVDRLIFIGLLVWLKLILPSSCTRPFIVFIIMIIFFSMSRDRGLQCWSSYLMHPITISVMTVLAISIMNSNRKLSSLKSWGLWTVGIVGLVRFLVLTFKL